MAQDLGNGQIKVTSGDTLYGIYGANWKALSGYGGDPTKLAIGTILPAPGKAPGSTAPAATAPTTTPNFSDNKSVTDFLNGFQNTMYSTPGVQSVEDILKTVKESLPGDRPTPPNLVKTYGDLRTQYGLDSLEGQINDINTQLQGVNSQFYTQQLDESGKPVAQNVIEGRISQEQKQAILKAQPLQDQLKTLTGLYTTKLNTVQTLMDLTGKDYNNAAQDYNDRYTQAINAVTLARGIRQDQVSESQKIIDNARADLQVYVNTIKDGGLDLSNISPQQQLQLNKLEVQSGFPVGFIQSIKADPKANIVFTSSNNGVTQVGLRNTDGTITVQTYGTPGSGKLTADEQLSKAYQTVTPQLQKVAGSDGYVSPDSFKKARSAWISAGAKASDFDTQFNGFVNPTHAADYGLANYSAFEKAQRGY